MRYWIFKANADRYRLSDRLLDPEPCISWRVSRHGDEIGPGDTVFVWRSGAARGVCATLRIDTPVAAREELEHERPYWLSEWSPAPEPRVLATITSRFPCLPSDAIKAVPGLSQMSVFTGFKQATNFPVSDSEAALLLNLILRWLQPSYRSSSN